MYFLVGIQNSFIYSPNGCSKNFFFSIVPNQFAKLLNAYWNLYKIARLRFPVATEPEPLPVGCILIGLYHRNYMFIYFHITFLMCLFNVIWHSLLTVDSICVI